MRVLILLLLLGSTLSYSQIPSLENYFQKLSDQYQCSFSYDNDLVAGVPFYADTTAASLEAYLKWMERSSAFRFSLSNGNLVLVEPKVPGANTMLRMDAQSETGEKINAFEIRSNRGTVKQQHYNGKTLTAFLLYNPNDTVTLTAELYAPQKVAVNDLLKKSATPIRMKEDTRLLNEVVVTSYMTTGVNYKKQNQTIEVDLESLPALPGQTDGDILNALEALPGISSSDGKAGSLNIRGSTSDQTYLMYDNIPIYHKGHFFGTLSPYNPLSVDKVNVSRSAFTADKGGRVGGAIEIISRKNYKDSTSFDLNLSTTYAGACLRLPVLKKKLGIMIAARTSYPLQYPYQVPKMKAITTFIYQESEVNRAMKDTVVDLRHYVYGFNDINVKIGGEINSRNSWQLSYLSINNNVRIEALDKKTKLLTHDNMLLYNNGFNLSYDRKWSNAVKTNISITNSYFTQKFYSDEIIEPTQFTRFRARFKNQLKDGSVRIETNWKATQRTSFLIGYEVKDHVVVNMTDNSSPTVKDSNDVTRLYVHAGYLNLNYNIRNKLYSTIGIRGVYNTYIRSWYAEPRASISYLLNNTISFKAAAGLFNQFLVQVAGVSIENVGGIENANWIVADGKAIPVNTGTQASLGTVITPGKGFVVDVEAYYKLIDGITVNNFVNFKSPNKYINGYTQTKGVDVLVKKKFNKLENWVSYSLSKTIMHFDSVSKEDLVWIWNQTHVVDLAAAYSVGSFRFSAIWKYRSGLSALPGIRTRMLAGPPSSGATGGTPPPPAQPPPGALPENVSTDEYREMFPDFHQLDLSAVYMIPSKKKWKASIGASVNNVYNRKNVVAQVKRQNTNPVLYVSKYTQGFSPNIQFNLSY